MSGLKKHWKWLCCAIGLLLAAGACTALFMGISNDTVIAYLNGYPITQDEIEFYEELEKSGVQNYFSRTYGVSLSDGDWDTSCEGEVPSEVLREYAMETCVENKALFILAYENGFIDYVDYQDFIKGMEQENKTRANALKQGEVVYGTKEFTAQTYLGHVTASLKTSLLNDLSKEKGDIFYTSDEEIMIYYQNNSEDWLFNVTTLSVTELQVYSEKTDTLQVANDIAVLLENGNSMEEILDVYGDTVTEIQREFTGSTYQTDMRSNYVDVMEAAWEMTESEVRIVGADNDYSVIRLDEKIVDYDSVMSEYRSRLRQTVLEEKYELYMEEYLDSLQLEQTGL